MKAVFGLLIILGVAYDGVAQDADYRVGWDFSYESVLNQNQIKWDHSQGTLFTWLKHRRDEHQYITDFVTEQLSREPEQVFLIDHPTFPSAGRTTIMGIKNKDQCFYYWRSTDEKKNNFQRSEISLEMFDQIFSRLHTLKQRSYHNMGGPEKAYAGFLSTFDHGQSRQVLLHIHDFLEFDAENHQILRVGRIGEIENSLQVKNNISFN
jgi:hypothetical protein